MDHLESSLISPLIGLILLILVPIHGQTNQLDYKNSNPTMPNKEHVNEIEEQHAHDKHANESGKNAREGENHNDHDVGKEKMDHENEQDEHNSLKFSPDVLKEFAIKLAQANSGSIRETSLLSGEVVVAPDKLFHVIPLAAGVVRKVFKQLGDSVKQGDLLVTLSSRELANAKTKLVAANSLLRLADASLKRERELYKKKVTAKREYLEAKQAQTKAAIELKSAKQGLLALGLSIQDVVSVLRSSGDDLTRYELRSPAEGIIIYKHAVHGEILNTEIKAFTIADLDRVWINLTVYQKDLPLIHKGQAVLISTRHGSSAEQSEFRGVIDWISPTLSESTRSGTARVILDNVNRRWRPGLFVNGAVVIAKTAAKVVIPRSALQNIEDRTVVFVQEGDEFEPRPVQLGRTDTHRVEIVQGLESGETFVSENAFTLKAQMSKSAFGGGHSH